MTKAEINIVLSIVRAKMAVYLKNRELNEIDEDESEEKYLRCLNGLKTLQRDVRVWEKEFFDGYITAKDIWNEKDTISSEIDDIADCMGYPLDKGAGIQEFFGDMIWNAKCDGELD